MQKQYLKPVFATPVLVTAALLCLLIAGCDSSRNTVPVEISVLYNEKTEAPFREDWLILKAYEDLQNIRLSVDTADDSEYILELQRRIESDQIPDIILKLWPNEIAGYSSRGLFLPISEYQENMPFFAEYIQENSLEADLAALRSNDGKLHLLPGFQRLLQPQQWIYRRDLFRAHGLEAPRDYETLFDSLSALKEFYPQATGITACWQGAHLFAMMGAGYGIPAGWEGNRLYDPTEDRWIYAPITEAYRAMMLFLNRCYAAELLDPEIFTQSDAEYYAKLQDGRALVTVSWISSGFDKWNTALEQSGVSGGEWAPLPVPESTIGIRALPSISSFRKGLALSSHLANNTRCSEIIQFLDWAVYSQEGRRLTAWGVENVTYRMTGQGPVFLETIPAPLQGGTTLDLTRDYGLHTLFDLNEAPRYEDLKRPREMVQFMETAEAQGEIPSPPPELRLDNTALGAQAAIEEKIRLYTQTTMKEFITGTLSPEEDWDSYLQELDNLGVHALMNIWNSAWKKHR